ncbi:MAG: cell division protein FtsA [Deltaproteobacteria bacterium]
MLKDNYICALDIGSSKIAAVVAEIRKRKISSVIFDNVPAKGIKKGSIVNSIDLVASIGQAVRNLRKKSGINIKFIYANISGQDIVAKHSSAIMPLAERGNKVITPYDIQKINEQARILGSSLEEEIIDQIPFGYITDSKNKILNPLGLYSHKLEVDLYLICGKLASIQSLIRAVNQSGFEIKDLFFSGVATAEAVLGGDLKEGQNIICDIGSDITEILLFKEGLLRHIEVLPLGGDNLTETLCEELKIPFELAEEVKISHAIIGDHSHISEEKEILIKKDNLYNPLKQKVVVELLTAKVKAMCQSIKESIEKLTATYKVNNLVATGRTVLQDGFLEALESSVGVPVRLGHISNPDIISLFGKDDTLSKQKYLPYVTALGMVCQALRKENPRVLPDYHPSPNLFVKAVSRVKEMYHEYF